MPFKVKRLLRSFLSLENYFNSQLKLDNKPCGLVQADMRLQTALASEQTQFLSLYARMFALQKYHIFYTRKYFMLCSLAARRVGELFM